MVNLFYSLSFFSLTIAQNASFSYTPPSSFVSSLSTSSTFLESTRVIPTSFVATQPVIQPSVSSAFTPFPVPSDIPETDYPATEPSYPPLVCFIFSTIEGCVHDSCCRLTLVCFLTSVLHGRKHGIRLKTRYEAPSFSAPVAFVDRNQPPMPHCFHNELTFRYHRSHNSLWKKRSM